MTQNNMEWFVRKPEIDGVMFVADHSPLAEQPASKWMIFGGDRKVVGIDPTLLLRPADKCRNRRLQSTDFSPA